MFLFRFTHSFVHSFFYFSSPFSSWCFKDISPIFISSMYTNKTLIFSAFRMNWTFNRQSRFWSFPNQFECVTNYRRMCSWYFYRLSMEHGYARNRKMWIETSKNSPESSQSVWKLRGKIPRKTEWKEWKILSTKSHIELESCEISNNGMSEILNANQFQPHFDWVERGRERERYLRYNSTNIRKKYGNLSCECGLCALVSIMRHTSKPTQCTCIKQCLSSIELLQRFIRSQASAFKRRFEYNYWKYIPNNK